MSFWRPRVRYKPRAPVYAHLQPTGPVDWIGRYGRCGPAILLRRRLRWAANALPADIGRVLEIGYGSGVFQYELSRRARASIGIDVHPHAARVRRQLQEDGVATSFVRGDGAELPFRSGSFDAVVILSSLEFIPDPESCLYECRRVLGPRGRLVCVRPRQLRLADLVFRVLTGVDPEAEFSGGRARAEAASRTALRDAKRYLRPWGWPRLMAPYELLLYDAVGADGPPLAASRPAVD